MGSFCESIHTLLTVAWPLWDITHHQMAIQRKKGGEERKGRGEGRRRRGREGGKEGEWRMEGGKGRNRGEKEQREEREEIKNCKAGRGGGKQLAKHTHTSKSITKCVMSSISHQSDNE